MTEAARPTDPVRRWVVLLSPIGVIGVCRGVQQAAGPLLGAWAWLPTMVLFWCVISGVIAWSRRDRPTKAWLAAPHGRHLWSFLAVGIGIVSVRELAAGWRALDSPGVLLLWLGFGLVNPWFEESYWRGLLIDAAGGAGRTRLLGVIYSSAAFAVSHPLIWGVHSVALRHPVAVLGLAVAGAVWGLAYWRTGSLRWTIVGHTCANLLGLSVPVLLNLYVPTGLRA
jgi:membrane protease YdiL (CAAX protease family)